MDEADDKGRHNEGKPKAVFSPEGLAAIRGLLPAWSGKISTSDFEGCLNTWLAKYTAHQGKNKGRRGSRSTRRDRERRALDRLVDGLDETAQATKELAVSGAADAVMRRLLSSSAKPETPSEEQTIAGGDEWERARAELSIVYHAMERLHAAAIAVRKDLAKGGPRSESKKGAAVFELGVIYFAASGKKPTRSFAHGKAGGPWLAFIREVTGRAGLKWGLLTGHAEDAARKLSAMHRTSAQRSDQIKAFARDLAIAVYHRRSPRHTGRDQR